MFFSETTFLLVKALGGFKKRSLRSNFLNLQFVTVNFNSFFNFVNSAKNWNTDISTPPPILGHNGGGCDSKKGESYFVDLKHFSSI